MTFVISCNQKEKKESAVAKEVIKKSVDSLSRDAKDLISNTTEVKEEKKIERNLDTLPPKKIIRTIKEYQKSINDFSKKNINGLITITDVEGVTPISQEEFIFYYGLTYSDESNQALHDGITTKVLDNAIEDNGMVFFLYADMAQFVDGEYAESYHSYIETVVSNNKKKFCAIYKYLSKESQRILTSLYLEVCKGIERTEEDY